MPFVARCHPNTTRFRGLPLLRDVHGLSADEVANLVALQPAVIMQTPDRINEIVNAVRSVGLEPGSPMFAHVFAIFSKLASTLESKVTCYRRFGFDNDCISLMIRRHPNSMVISEKKIAEIVGFLTSKAGLSLEDIVVYPTMLVRSLEVHSRRWAVFAVLRRAGKRQGQFRLSVALVSAESRFLQVCVLPHADELPDVLRAIKGEIPFEVSGGSEEKPMRPRKKKMCA